ncbi:serine protease [Mesorhizobium sp. M0965]|uniref:S1 family peptidase n=1 Tax=unclassified Mesorhizobium TaxID=325217 RepID=UPI003335AC8C
MRYIGAFVLLTVLILVTFAARAQVPVVQDTSSIVYIRVNVTLSGNDRTKGSGLILNQSGFILTDRHIVEDFDPSSERLLVSMRSVSSAPVPADIIQCSTGASDLCLIKISSADVAAANVTAFFTLTCQPLIPGNQVRAVGFPFGQPLVQVAGEITGELGGNLAYPMDAAVVPGMSGGPVFGVDQTVIGLVLGASPSPALTFVTPFSAAVNLINQASINCPSGPSPAPPVIVADLRPSQIIRKVNESITIDDLPPDAFQITNRISSAADLQKVFSGLPELHLIGSTLRIEGKANPGDVTLYLSKLVLRNSAIWIGTKKVRVFVGDLVAENASIRAFPADFVEASAGRGAAETERTGENGETGLSGGMLEIYILKSKSVTQLESNLTGQDGGQGGQGGRGREGAPGEPGRSGSDSLFDCRRGPGNGGRGRPGSQGGVGGVGGDGGNGGYLTFYLLADANFERKGLTFVSKGGAGGRGGPGGPGGIGGPGGPRGSQTTYCHGGSDGPRGEDGPAGIGGADGRAGTNGFMDIVGVDIRSLPLPGLALP